MPEGGGTPSIGSAPLPVLEVFCTHTLTLFVKMPFQFWRKKFFQNKVGKRLLRSKTIIQINTEKHFQATLSTLPVSRL